MAPGPAFAVARLGTATLLLAAALAVGATRAQGAAVAVTDVLPSTTVAVFHVAPVEGAFAVVQEILDGLDLERAMATLSRLDGGSEADDLADLFGGAPLTLFVDELASECPEAADVLRGADAGGLMGPVAVAVSVSPFNPLPAVLIAARPDDGELASMLLDSMIACGPEGTTLQEGDVTLYVIDDGGDAPFVIATVDGLLLAGSEPELVRTAVRLARGSDEPRHVDGGIGREAAAWTGGGIGVTVDLAALADALAGLRGMVPAGPEADVLVDRLLASLRTVGGFAARVTMDRDGVLVDTVIASDPAGGDARLLRLLACEDCRVGDPRLIPSGAASLDARAFTLADVVAWLDEWLVDAGTLIGEPLDLRTIATQFAGVDLDAALLGWAGTTWHTARLDVLGTDARGWLGGLATVTTVPVTSEAAARAGLETWKEALDTLPALAGGLLSGIPGGALPFGDVGAFGPGGLLSVRTIEYRGVSYERWRVGPATDVGVLVIDDHLVIASPATAMRRVVDVHLGAPSVRDDAGMGAALARVPAGASAYSITDVARTLRGLATISDFLAAPAASAVAFVISEVAERPVDGPVSLTGFDRGPASLGSDPRADGATFDGEVTVPGSLTGVIGSDDQLATGQRGIVLELVGHQPGDVVELEMLDPSRSDIDTYLYLFDLDAGAVVASNDDAPWTERSEIVFRVEPGTRYAVVASSYSGFDTGSFVLNATVLVSAQAAAAPDAAPSTDGDEARVTFDDVLGLFDLVTGLLEGLADRSGIALGVTETVDGVTRSTLRIPLR